MEHKAMQKLPLRLLLNAEPFGFGPTAAIAGFFPHLRSAFETVGYLGKKHTLDLQRGLPYDAIHDVSDAPKSERSKAYKSILSQYDILLTAMDHKVAQAAQKAGLKVFYYDALTWYWKNIPKSARTSDLYIAQNFFGVEDRLRKLFADHPTAYTVPLITTATAHEEKEKKNILINLGGLQNPYWPINDVVAYARSIIGILRKAIPASEQVIIAASRSVAEPLKEMGLQTYTQEDMQSILAQSKMAFMTPGLGNIYDAAAYNIPTVWLPPANDSQGQQLVLIGQKGMMDAAIDWRDILPDVAINYSDDQITVLGQIAGAATELAGSDGAQRNLLSFAQEQYQALAGTMNSKTSILTNHFGNGGAKKVADFVVEQARRCFGYDHYFSLPGDLAIHFRSPHDIKDDRQVKLQLGAYVPGISFIEHSPAKIDITVEHIFSDTPRLEQTGGTIRLYTPQTDTFSPDFYHLLYGIERRELIKREFYVAHSACVGRGDDYTLIVGHSGSGKTTLAQKLVDEGLKLFSGNKTVIHFNAAGEMMAVAGTRTMTALDGNLKRYAYELDASDYAAERAVKISSIALVRVNDGVEEEEKLSPLSALHTLYPYFMDSVNADVVVNGNEIFDGAVPEGAKGRLIQGLEQALSQVPVRKMAGSPEFLERTFLQHLNA